MTEIEPVIRRRASLKEWLRSQVQELMQVGCWGKPINSLSEKRQQEHAYSVSCK